MSEDLKREWWMEYVTAGVDTQQLLSNIRDIYKTANVPDVNGTQLNYISGLCKALLISAGWNVPERLETDTPPFFEEDREDSDDDPQD